jgi:hypothetical protein
MAKKISQLTQATEVKSDDVTVIVQDGETKKLPLNLMVTKQDIENKKVTGLAKLDEIEATYENDTYTPTITVKNKSSVKTGEGDEVDYSANVMDGHAKSAILSGQTLVNLIDYKTVINSGSGLNTLTTNNKNEATSTTTQVGSNILCFKPTFLSNGTYLAYFNFDTTGLESFYIGSKTSYWNTFYTLTKGINKMKLTINEEIDFLWIGNIVSCESNVSITVKDFILIPYQEGMENWDIPYFEGMQSVKMPVLTTTGKNLLKPNRNSITSIHLKKGTTLILSTKNSIPSLGGNAKFYDIDGNPIWMGIDAGSSSKKFTLPRDIYRIENTLVEGDGLEYQLEVGTVATPYEPYKSNILTVNEDVELRGIGDVRDTLDCLTGEVTSKIEEVLIDCNGYGINGLKELNNLVRFYIFGRDIGVEISNNAQFNTISDNFISSPKAFDDSSDFECVYVGYNAIYFKLNKNRLSEITQNGVANWFKSNPTTVCWVAEHESIKTVDLMPSGTHPSTTPYCWKNGHIQLSSSGLLPNLEYSVVTSRAGQINQNATMIVKNDKRIFDLEILLAGGLVNTTYQALTLQNQVETGLSKVSLNSETEPDYLLYHMIMKLIEEKAYKLDDLAEKVSVFYLYEKLSDEQFETIYSALYPFAEDEIIEEPVVEELPEVVEDEVIM